jgi:transcriptional regulator with XRE-family HTH domain
MKKAGVVYDEDVLLARRKYGLAIKQARQRRGLTLDMLAHELAVGTRGGFGNIEIGRRWPSAELASLLQDKLGVAMPKYRGVYLSAEVNRIYHQYAKRRRGLPVVATAPR